MANSSWFRKVYSSSVFYFFGFTDNHLAGYVWVWHVDNTNMQAKPLDNYGECQAACTHIHNHLINLYYTGHRLWLQHYADSMGVQHGSYPNAFLKAATWEVDAQYNTQFTIKLHFVEHSSMNDTNLLQEMSSI